MHWLRPSYFVLASTLATALAGCGVTRSTDTSRTATEQLLVSDAIDRAIQTMNLQALAGQTVFLDDTKVADVVDKNYLVSSLRQYLLANGCQLRDKREEAEFVVEARAGAVGTDRNDLLFGIPSINVPQIPLVQPIPAVIPEIPIAKRKDQRGVAKLAVFAYHRETGTPVWQSGILREESSANDVWILGAGPFQRGTIYEGTEFAGNAITGDASKEKPSARRLPPVELAREKVFTPPRLFTKPTPTADPKVAQAAHQEPASQPAQSATTAPAAAPIPAEPPVTASKPPEGPTSTPPRSNASANVDPKRSEAVVSAYLEQANAAPLPQPRFNSPK
jgi:hypothetical protein